MRIQMLVSHSHMQESLTGMVSLRLLSEAGMHGFHSVKQCWSLPQVEAQHLNG